MKLTGDDGQCGGPLHLNSCSREEWRLADPASWLYSNSQRELPGCDYSQPFEVGAKFPRQYDQSGKNLFYGSLDISVIHASLVVATPQFITSLVQSTVTRQYDIPPQPSSPQSTRRSRQRTRARNTAANAASGPATHHIHTGSTGLDYTESKHAR